MKASLSIHFLPMVLMAHHTNKMPFARLKLPCLSFDDVSALNCKSNIDDLRRQFYLLETMHWQNVSVLPEKKTFFLSLGLHLFLPHFYYRWSGSFWLRALSHTWNKWVWNDWSKSRADSAHLSKNGLLGLSEIPSAFVFPVLHPKMPISLANELVKKAIGNLCSPKRGEKGSEGKVIYPE